MSYAESTPFFFGAPERPLFGCYHAPQPGIRQSCGVVICYPLGQEYMNSHRALRHLAVRLSQAGCPVLRFDYFGCGDSGGECEQAGVPQWLMDISLAIAEVKKRSGLKTVCLVGLRLGGTLSTMVGAEQSDLDGLVLWDPIVSGKRYLAELTSLHRQRTKPPRFRLTWAAKSGGPTEILGLLLTHATVAELERVDLLRIRRAPARHVLLVASAEDSSKKELAGHLGKTCIHMEYRHLPGRQVWMSASEGALHVPKQILQSVASWIVQSVASWIVLVPA